LRALAADLPGQLRAGFRSGLAIAPPGAERSTPVFAVGVGGSAIAADLARVLLDAETPVALVSVRSDDLPRAVERKSRILLVSYSGETEETVRAYDRAKRVGASPIVLTSGGALAERAERDGVPLLLIPAGLPPRWAIGYLLGGILGLFDPWFPESNEERLERALARLSGAIPALAAPNGPADRLARQIGDKSVHVFAETALVGLARRWKAQIEENAKRSADFDELPELLHNALVAWDALPRARARREAVVLLDWLGSRASARRRARYLERLLERRGVTVLTAAIEPEDRLEAALAGLSLGDHVALFLAEQAHVDPYPIDAIVRMRRALVADSRR